MAKRLDLQGLRGLAIISVLLFHFYPKLAPNGYLGVDQFSYHPLSPLINRYFRFFVLSGFLMCMLLKRAQTQTWHQLILIFYSKRFKRILPLYLLLIFLSIMALYQFYPENSIEMNQKSAGRALMFVSNVPSEEEEENDYFQRIALSIDIFSHTWSLSVEVQYYFLVPFLFLLVNYFEEKVQFLCYGVIGLISFIFYSISDDTVAFNSVFSRIWQFLIGMVVYLITDNQPKNQYTPLITDIDQDTDKVQKIDIDPFDPPAPTRNIPIEICKYLFLISLITMTTCPWTLPVLIVRPLTTVITGLFMLISQDDLILSNRVLTYIGDISYSSYLIHWPICAYFRMQDEVDNYDLIAGLLASILLAILIFESFEKWYLHLSSTSIGLLSVTLFFISVLAINTDIWADKDRVDVSGLEGIRDNMTIEDVEILNTKWNANDRKNLFTEYCEYEKQHTAFGWCRHNGLSENAKYRFAIFGNSWTANHADLVHEECGHKAKSILQGSQADCEPLYPTRNTTKCISYFNEFSQRIEQEQPDLGFILTRSIGIAVPPTDSEVSKNQDPIYEIMKAQMQKLIRNIKKKLYILTAIPNINIDKNPLITKLMENGTDPVEIDKILVNPEGYQTARDRYSRLQKDCGGKCEIIDYFPLFYKNSTQTFRYFDEKGLAFLTTGIHFSPLGLEYLRPTWKKICRKI